MSTEVLKPVVRQITVEASNKAWRTGPLDGSSGGSTFQWTVEPVHENGSWTVEEARNITLMMRRELESLLIADARARGKDDPDQGEVTLQNYDTAIKMFGGRTVSQAVSTEGSNGPG